MITTVILGVGIALLGVAAVLTLIRMSKGPTTLDRVVAADVLIAIVIAALATEAVVHRHTTTLPVILVLSLLGFAGSLSIARFVSARATSVTSEVDPDGPSRDSGSKNRPSQSRGER